MEILILFALTILNVGISWWDAAIAGKVWVESKAIGGFIRLVVWSAAIQSAVGFSIAIATVLALGGTAFHLISPGASKVTLDVTFLAVVLPALGSGLIITISSWTVACREQSLRSLGVAAWNSLAMAHDSAAAVTGIGGAFADAIEVRDEDDLAFWAGLLLAAIALALGIGLTWAIIRHYAGAMPLPERHEPHPAQRLSRT